MPHLTATLRTLRRSVNDTNEFIRRKCKIFAAQLLDDFMLSLKLNVFINFKLRSATEIETAINELLT